MHGVGGVEELAGRHGLFLCVGCGKCVAVCPMAKLFADFSYDASPRGVIERALLGLPEENGELWLCLTCELCTSVCPQGVQIRDFVIEARGLAVDAGETKHGSFCRDCGDYLWPRHTVEHMKRALGEAGEEHLTLCPRCRRHDHARRMRAIAPKGHR
ncbi:MAG: 4Fe-4S dicluster domain-containing protein [Planctomycetota bacterium]